MIDDKMKITDEQLACYLEGKLTGEEKQAVEAYLSANKEAMDTLMMARYEMGFRKVRRHFYVYAIIGLVMAAGLALLLWRLLTPIQMKVNITEDKVYAIPNVPFEDGTLECDYANNALQRIPITAESRTVFLNDIPYRLKSNPVHLVFEAEGYQTIDTVVKAQRCVELRIRRNNDLGVVFGRVCDFESGQPIEGASVSLLDLTTTTDALGQFRIEIPFEKQDEAQRVSITKEGYQTWDELYRPSATEPWLISLEKEVQP